MASDKEAIVRVENLSKQYKSLKAVDCISFEIYRGEVLGFLGPNGAGKSTTIDLITTLQQPSGGKISYPGFHNMEQVKSIRRHIGIVPQELALYGNLTVEDNLKYIGTMYGLQGQQLYARINALLQQFDLSEKSRDRVRILSGGQKRRLNFALADIHEPELIVLDEPTVGLDPNARQLVWQTIQGFRQAGKTVLLTTHYMDEAEILCDRILLIDRGRIVAEGTPSELKITLSNEIVLNFQVSNLISPQLMQDLRLQAGIQQASLEGNTLRIVVCRESSEAIKGWLAGTSLGISGLKTDDISLEDVFVHFTGRTFLEAEAKGVES